MAKFTFLAIGFTLIGIIGLFAVLYCWENQDTHIQKYGLVFDAGSSHTTLFIYTWDGAKTNGTAVVKEVADFTNHSNPGISHFNDPNQAAKSLETYLEFAKKNIPKEKIKTTPVYLGATAGMRLLRESNQNASNAIFESIQNFFVKSGFQISNPKHQVRILSGSEEGTFSWITVNYLKGNMRLTGQSSLPHVLEKPSTTGALDLGGGSTQITFIPALNYSIPENFSFSFSLYGKPMKVYTHSFLCYGVNEVIRKYHALLVKENKGMAKTISSPCWLIGSSKNDSSDNIFKKPCTYDSAYSNVSMDYHFVGTANYTECQRIINSLFDFKNCPYKDGCSFNEVYQPSVKHRTFMAFSVFYYVMATFNLTEKRESFSLQAYNNAVYSWCNKTWQEARLTPGKEKFLAMTCIEAVYIKTILTKGYHFDNTSWNSLEFNMKVNGNEVGWTLGFMVYTSNSIAAETGQQLSILIFSLLLVLFAVFIVFAIFFAIIAFKPTEEHSRLLTNDFTNGA